MKPLLFLDTETTDLENGRLIELAYATGDVMNVVRAKPPMPISIEAMAVHHITPAMVASAQEFVARDDYTYIKEQIECSIVVAHNAPFDIAVLEREAIHPKDYIDTKQLAAHLIPESPSHRLQYLRYFLNLPTYGPSQAHSAEGDVMVLMALFNFLMEKLSEGSDYATALVQAKELSKLPAVLRYVSFGKYRGRPWSAVASEDRGYLEWLSRNPHDDPNVQHTVAYCLGKR
jgi:exodeoxyribonuclease X